MERAPWFAAFRHWWPPALRRALYDWQQTADASERENAAWRGFGESAEILCEALNRDRRITYYGTVYTQERWAERLRHQLASIRAENSL